MHTKINSFLVLICLFFVGCSLMPNEMKTAQRIMETNPDSALHILQHMQPYNSLTEADRAMYGLLLFQALDKNNQPLQPDSVISFSVDYFQRVNDKPHLAYCYFYKARIYKKVQRFDEATLLYLKTLDLIQNHKDYNLLGEICSDMGDICSIQKDYEAALQKYQMSINWYQTGGYELKASYKLIDISRMYLLLKDYAKARQFCTKLLTKSSDSILQGVALQEMGINYYWEKQFDSAKIYLRKSLQYPYKGTNYAIRCYVLADLFLDINQFDSALFYANKSLNYPSTFFNQRDCYRILANTKYMQGDFKSMAFYMTKYQACTDSVRIVETQTKTTVLENIHQTNGAYSKSRQFLHTLFYVIPIMIFVGIFIFYRLRIRNKKSEKDLELAEVKLSNKHQLLKNSIGKKIEDSRALQSKVRKAATPEERTQLDKDLFEKCLHVSDWQAFSTEINVVYNQLISKLEAAFPALNQKEIMFCCFQVLGLSHADKMLLLDTTSDGLYKLKQRLSKKLKLNSAKELDAFLNNLLES